MINLEEKGREEAKEQRPDDRQGQRLEAEPVILPKQHAEKGTQEDPADSQFKEQGHFLDCLSFPPSQAKKISGTQDPDDEKRRPPASRSGADPADA